MQHGHLSPTRAPGTLVSWYKAKLSLTLPLEETSLFLLLCLHFLGGQGIGRYTVTPSTPPPFPLSSGFVQMILSGKGGWGAPDR